MIRHHPSDATLIAHAAGTLPVLHGQVVAAHLTQCTACRAVIRLGVELGSALLETVTPLPVVDDGLARVLARLDTLEPETESVPAPAGKAVTLKALSQGGRWRWVGPGIKLMPLVPRDATGTRLDLVRVSPGTALPRHDHRGPEMTCVLKGAFADKLGEYHVGDLEEGDVGLDHEPRALEGEECVCIIATTGYLRAHGLFTRVLQPIFGI